MPKFHEVFCSKPNKENAEKAILIGNCPLSDSPCDGGGNRHQTKLKPKELIELFGVNSELVKSVIPAVCSIDYGKDPWIVCPRRLFAFPKTKDGNFKDNVSKLLPHEKNILLSCGFQKGDKIGIWPEVYLQFSDESSEINYHFDFIVAKLRENDCTLESLRSELEIDSTDKLFNTYLKKSGLIQSRAQPSDLIKYLPDLNNFAVLEVMTASTSGSNTEKGTDIKSAYKHLLTGQNHDCPGINKRQVWGRMATQLFSKSALAEAWDTSTYWIVQDKLLENIKLTTKLDLNVAGSSESLVNFLELGYSEKNEYEVNLLNRYALDSGIPKDGSGQCIDILLPKVYPSKNDLMKCILKTRLSYVVTL